MRSVVSLHNALASNSLFASILWSHSLRPGDSELALLTTPNSHHFQIPLNCTFSERMRPSARALSALRSMRQSVLSASISAFRTPWPTRKRVNPRRFAVSSIGTGATPASSATSARIRAVSKTGTLRQSATTTTRSHASTW
jgi:hypothetical protein